jgi:3-methyladenine DNA glycosylase Tag
VREIRRLGLACVLSEMTNRVFSAGFAWSVIKVKCSGFEEAILSFKPGRLSFQPDEFWDGLTNDARIVRNGGGSPPGARKGRNP